MLRITIDNREHRTEFDKAGASLAIASQKIEEQHLRASADILAKVYDDLTSLNSSIIT